MDEFTFGSPSLLENQNKIPKELIELSEEPTELPEEPTELPKEPIKLPEKKDYSAIAEKNLQELDNVIRFIYGVDAEKKEEEEESQVAEDLTESPNKTSLARDIESIVDRAIFGLPELLEDVGTFSFDAINQLLLDKEPNSFVTEKAMGFFKEKSRDAQIRIYNENAKIFGATVVRNDKNVVATFENLSPEQQAHVLERMGSPPETLTGQALDIATMILGGAKVYGALPEGMGAMRKALISEQLVMQSLATEESLKENMSNIARDWGNTFEDENFLKSFLTNPVTQYLAAGENDSKALLRAKMALTDAFVFGIGEGAFKLVGLTLKGANNLSQTMYKKSVDQLKKREVDKLFENILGGLKGELRLAASASSLVLGVGMPPLPFIKKTAKELSDDEAQLIKQTTKQNANILSEGASFLYRIKQRWFTSRGYAPLKAWEAEQRMVRRVRALRTEADITAKRLQYFLDRAIHQYDGDIVKNITNALESKPSTLEPAERLAELQSKFNLPKEVAVEVLQGRNMIDRLSQMVVDSNIGTENIRDAITENLTTYTRRAYRMYEEKGFIPSQSARNKATKFFRDQFLSKEYGISLKEIENGKI